MRVCDIHRYMPLGHSIVDIIDGDWMGCVYAKQRYVISWGLCKVLLKIYKLQENFARKLGEIFLLFYQCEKSHSFARMRSFTEDLDSWRR